VVECARLESVYAARYQGFESLTLRQKIKCYNILMEFIKKNFALLLAFLLPVLLIVVVALTAYLPSLFVSTNYNFLYTTCVEEAQYYYPYNCDYYLQKRYSIVNDKLVANTLDPNLDHNNDKIPDINEYYTPHIFLHDTEKNESREITFDEAQTLTLSGLITSPDGVAVSGQYSDNSDFLIFDGGSSSYEHYLSKRNGRKQLNIISNTHPYPSRTDFQFVGWVLPGRE